MCPVSEILPIFRILKPGSRVRDFETLYSPIRMSYRQELLNQI